MSGTVQEIADAIKQIIDVRGEVSGSTLATTLKTRIPDWSPAKFGVRSLREFISLHVPWVGVIGRAGMDVLYAATDAPQYEGDAIAPAREWDTDDVPVIGGFPPDPVVSHGVRADAGQIAARLRPPNDTFSVSHAGEQRVPPAAANFWRVWVSPKSPYVLAVDPQDGQISCALRGAPALPGALLLTPPGLDVHQQIATSFLPKVPAPVQAKLRSLLQSDQRGWWQAWTRQLLGTEWLSAWNTFRREQLEQRLHEQLQHAGLAPALATQIVAAIREHQTAAPPRHRAGTTPQVAVLDSNVLRNVVLEVVQRMSSSELRELRVPLGLVLEAVELSKSR